MRRRRALTLVEVLASTILLAIIAGVCAPLLQQAMRALDAEPPPFAMHELETVADGVLADGVEAILDAGVREIPWPDEPDRPPVRVGVVEAHDPEADHAWLALGCAGMSVFRWMPLPEDESERVPEPSGGAP